LHQMAWWHSTVSTVERWHSSPKIINRIGWCRPQAAGSVKFSTDSGDDRVF
jgi:hypothetical protein